jgi:1-acyl-sn-glycerol-3-phosphate acyltransferase
VIDRSASDWVTAPRAAVIALLLMLWTLLLLPIQAVIVALRLPNQHMVPRLYHRGTCILVGIQVRRSGEAVAEAPVLFVSNHTSYLDIVVLFTQLEAAFVSKGEVATWPLFGLLARLANTIFIERRPSRSGAQRDEIRGRLEAGGSLILFPEGTSSDGNRILPFRSTFFSVAEKPLNGKPLTVQPVSLVYTHNNNLPIGRRERPFFTWYGETELMPHLWNVLCRGQVTVEVRLYPPVTIDAFQSRKELASACQNTIAIGVSAALSGRNDAPVVSKPDASQAASARSA